MADHSRSRLRKKSDEVMESPKICILLAAYNGAAYIRQQIDSVLEQDYTDIRLILSDDGSEDGTAEILEEYAVSFPEKVIFYRSGRHFGSPQAHFMHLLAVFRGAPYLMFCDQDDVWHKNKVRKTLETMKAVEKDPTFPTLVHTDLHVVDRERNRIATSFCAYSHIDGNRLLLNQLLVQNVVTGCTVMINHALAELACTAIPKNGMVMHDWWLALLASACGAAGFLNEPTVDYRQHDGNCIGAKKVRSVRYLWERLSSEKKMRDALTAAAWQAESFLACYGARLDLEQTQLLRAFASIKGKGILERDLIFLRHRLLKDGMIRILPQLLGM